MHWQEKYQGWFGDQFQIMLCWKDKISQVRWSADVGKWEKNNQHDNQPEKQTLIFHSQLNQGDCFLAEGHWLTFLLHTWGSSGAESAERREQSFAEGLGQWGNPLSGILVRSGQGTLYRGKCRSSASPAQVCLGMMFLVPVVTDSKAHWIRVYVLANGGHPSSLLQHEFSKCKVKLSDTPRQKYLPRTSQNHSWAQNLSWTVK